MSGIFSKFKQWIVDEEEEYEVEEAEEVLEKEDADANDFTNVTNSTRNSTSNTTNNNKVVNLHGANQMKVVIVEPKKYEDVTIIADHLKQKKAVIVNLEGLSQDVDTRKSIFFFMSGAVYVLNGTIQKVSKAIFILAPNNVDIDANIKKELESKAFFPWQK